MTDAPNSAAPLPQQDSYVSWGEFLRSGYSAPLALVCLAVWLHAADSLIVATMLPSMVSDIGGAAFVSWTVSIYEIGSIVAGAGTALLTMRYGLRGPMSVAAALFGLGCLLSAVSPTMGVVLIGRVMQGLGGGGMVAMAFVAVGVLFPRRYAARVLAVCRRSGGFRPFWGPCWAGSSLNMPTGAGALAFSPCRPCASRSGSPYKAALAPSPKMVRSAAFRWCALPFSASLSC